MARDLWHQGVDSASVTGCQVSAGLPWIPLESSAVVETADGGDVLNVAFLLFG